MIHLTYLFIATLLSPDPESQLLLLWTHNASFGHHEQPAIIMQQNRKRVIESAGILRSLRADKPGYLLGQTEQMHRLVQQVGSKVVNCTAPGNHLVLPLVRVRGRLFGTVTIEARFEFNDSSEDAGVD